MTAPSMCPSFAWRHLRNTNKRIIDVGSYFYLETKIHCLHVQSPYGLTYHCHVYNVFSMYITSKVLSYRCKLQFALSCCTRMCVDIPNDAYEYLTRRRLLVATSAVYITVSFFAKREGVAEPLMGEAKVSFPFYFSQLIQGEKRMNFLSVEWCC